MARLTKHLYRYLETTSIVNIHGEKLIHFIEFIMDFFIENQDHIQEISINWQQIQGPVENKKVPGYAYVAECLSLFFMMLVFV